MSAKRKEPTFEDHLREAETIVRELEAGTLPLEESIERYEKAVAALRQCHAILEAAEKRIETLTRAKDGSLETRPFDPPA